MSVALQSISNLLIFVSENDVVLILFLTTVSLSVLLAAVILLLVILLCRYSRLKRTMKGSYSVLRHVQVNVVTQSYYTV